MGISTTRAHANGAKIWFSIFCKTNRAFGGSWKPWNSVGRFSVPRTMIQMILLSSDVAGNLPVTRIDFWNGTRLVEFE